MTSKKFCAKRPLTDDEESEIQRMIASDPDNPELSDAQIRVNTIAPETTETEQVAMAAFMKPQYRDQPEIAARSIPLGRFGHPSDHAGAAIYLATDLSVWVTGTTIHVDGGGLAAGGMQRLPDGGWTVTPIVTDTAMGG